MGVIDKQQVVGSIQHSTVTAGASAGQAMTLPYGHAQPLCVPTAPLLLLQEFDKFGRSVVDFALLGLPAAVVNSGLKFMQKNLELSFQQRWASRDPVNRHVSGIQIRGAGEGTEHSTASHGMWLL